MKNLLEETKEFIKEHNLLIKDIEFIGSEDGEYSCSWKEFVELSDFEYDDGYGGQEIAEDLVISFKGDCIMRRGEYDGREWWELYCPIKKTVFS